MRVPEKRIYATHREPCSANPELLHHTQVKLADDVRETAADVIAAIDAHEAHYVMYPPEGAPAYRAHQETGLPLIVQVRECPDCGEQVLFA